MTNITIEDIQAAAARINVHRTPVITCSTLDTVVSEATDNSVQLLFKCEALQKTGCKNAPIAPMCEATHLEL